MVSHRCGHAPQHRYDEFPAGLQDNAQEVPKIKLNVRFRAKMENTWGSEIQKLEEQDSKSIS